MDAMLQEFRSGSAVACNDWKPCCHRLIYDNAPWLDITGQNKDIACCIEARKLFLRDKAEKVDILQLAFLCDFLVLAAL